MCRLSDALINVIAITFEGHEVATRERNCCVNGPDDEFARMQDEIFVNPIRVRPRFESTTIHVHVEDLKECRSVARAVHQTKSQAASTDLGTFIFAGHMNKRAIARVEQVGKTDPQLGCQRHQRFERRVALSSLQPHERRFGDTGTPSQFIE